MAFQGVAKTDNLYSELACLFAVLLSVAVEHTDDESEIVVYPVVRRYGFKPGDHVFERRAAHDPVNILGLRVSGAEDVEGFVFSLSPPSFFEPGWPMKVESTTKRVTTSSGMCNALRIDTRVVGLVELPPTPVPPGSTPAFKYCRSVQML